MTTTSRLPRVIAVTLAAFVLTGCTTLASPATTSAPVETVAPAAPSTEDLAAYFGAIAGSDPVEMARVADELTAQNSNAYAYAIEQGAASQAYLDAGFPFEASRLETRDAGFALCYPNLDGTETCSAFDNLVYVDGKLADFDAGGEPLAGRITLGSADLIPLGTAATARLIAAYRTIAGSVDVVLEVKSQIDGFTIGYGSSYLAPDGRQSNPTAVTGPTELRNGSLGNYLFSFDGAKFGGTLRVVGYDAAYNELAAEIAIASN